MEKLNERNSWKERYPKGFGCLSAFFMYFALAVAVQLLYKVDDDEIILSICLFIACCWGFFVYKRAAKSQIEKKNPVRSSIKRVLIIISGVLFIGVLGMLVFIGLNSESEEDEIKELSSNISDYSIEQRRNLWDNRIYDINNKIYELDRQDDELLEYQNTTIGAISSYWDNTNEKKADIRKKIRLLRKELPKDPIGKGKLAQEGRYLYVRKHPSFESDRGFKVCSNDLLDLIYKSVPQNTIDIIKNEVEFFDGNFQNAEDEAEAIWFGSSNANAYINNKKEKKRKERELAKNTKKVSDLLKQFKKQYKEDWWLVRYEYQEGYIHSVHIKKSDVDHTNNY